MKYPVFTFILLFTLSACQEAQTESRYVAAEGAKAVVYTMDESQHLQPADSLVRGTLIRVNTENCVSQNKQDYFAFEHEHHTFYIAEAQTVGALNEVVQEAQIWVRTPASVIDDTVHSHIAGLLGKGQKYAVTGFDKLLSNGQVNRYQVDYNGVKGFVYAQYTVLDSAQAQARYLPQIQDSIHLKVRNTFGGGEAIGCDYYPVQKPCFKDNPMPQACYSLYLNIAAVSHIDDYIQLAKQTKINTFVIDIKDNECPGYKAEAMQTYSPTNFKWGGAGKEEKYRYAVQKLHKEGFYVVGRITCFKDSYFAKDHPECTLTEKATGQPFYHNKAYWPSAYDRAVWQFNVELAKEAVRKFGFNEINFDYVRFPDRLQSIEDQIDYHNRFHESKVQAIQRFVQYACDEIHALGAYVSVDVFGETANRGYTMPYGQYWPAISNVVDVMCGMPYPDHFAPHYAGIAKPWNNPYQTLLVWGRAVQARQAETPTPAQTRTWVQAYHVMHHVDPNGIDYNAANIEQEIRGLFEAGLRGGYITWLASSSLERYQTQKAAFQIDYLQKYPTQP